MPALIGALVVAGCAQDSAKHQAQSRQSPTPNVQIGTQAHHPETVFFPAEAFQVYANASCFEEELKPGEVVHAICLIYDPHTTVTSTRGLWYRIINPHPKPGDPTILYAAANIFDNVPPGHPESEVNSRDPTLPICDDSPSKDPPPVRH